MTFRTVKLTSVDGCHIGILAARPLEVVAQQACGVSPLDIALAPVVRLCIIELAGLRDGTLTLNRSTESQHSVLCLRNADTIVRTAAYLRA